jgi:hypothetical protein
MQRILDLDLDFFLNDAAILRGPDDGRLDGADFPPWPLEQVLAFLHDQCGLRKPMPGFVVENHGELFSRWREAIDGGQLNVPFHVTHVDAHADLGLGDLGYVYLMTSLLYEEPENRHPRAGQDALGDGNYLAFAISCRWLGELVYVFNDGGNDGDDALLYVLEGFDPQARNIQLAAVRSRQELFENLMTPKNLTVEHVEPTVPFARTGWRDFQADQPFDFVCLARSPTYTPPEADAIFDEIRQRFIAEASADA